MKSNWKSSKSYLYLNEKIALHQKHPTLTQMLTTSLCSIRKQSSRGMATVKIKQANETPHATSILLLGSFPRFLRHTNKRDLSVIIHHARENIKELHQLLSIQRVCVTDIKQGTVRIQNSMLM